MRKSILILLACVLGFSTVAQAQRRGGSGRNVSLGLKAGASLTSFTGADAGPFTNRFGFHGGIFANIGLTSLFAFQPELLYSMKGAEVNGNSNNTYRLHYVDIPLAFHLNADGLFFELGPQLGILASAKHNVNNVSADVTDAYNTVDFGYLAGLGYQLKQGVGIGLRYNGAFTNVEKAVGNSSISVQNRRRNSAFQLYLTYSFQGR